MRPPHADNQLTEPPFGNYSVRMSQLAEEDVLTAEDLFMISSSDGLEELDRGTLVRMPPAGALHGSLALRLACLLQEHVEAAELGVVCGADTGFILSRSPDTVRAPDASFVARERVPADGPPATYWPLAPDLAVEIISPWDRVGALEDKIAQYFGAGTRLVWVIHPGTRSVHVYRSPLALRVLGADHELTGEPVLPDFRWPLRRLFV